MSSGYVTSIRISGALLLLCSAWGQAAARPSPVEIRQDNLRSHVHALADDSLAGRAVGEPGIRLAEEYIAGQFKRYGLEPMPESDGFFHEFEVFERRYAPRSNTMEFVVGENVIAGELHADFNIKTWSDVGAVEGPLVFAGHGIVAPKQGYDDYAGLDVEGRIVLVLAHEPHEAEHRPRLGIGTYDKADIAEARGAVALIEVTDPLNHPPGDDMRDHRSMRLGRPKRSAPEETDSRMLIAVVSREMVRRLLVPSGHSLADLQRAVEAGTPPREMSLGDVQARLRVSVPVGARTLPARNVVGWLPGRSPERADEWIVVAAHHDHLGQYRGEGDTIYNGADDNASGVAGLLEVARSLAADEQGPGRSVVFVTYTAEEQALLGSKALARDHPEWMSRVVFMLNMDMIGRNPDRPLFVFGDGFAAGLRQMVEPLAASHDIAVSFSGDFYTDKSDHDVYFKLQLPFVTLFSGYHDDYHRPGDEVGKLSYSRMTAIAGMARDLVTGLCRVDRTPTFQHPLRWLGAAVRVERRGRERVAVVSEPAANSPARRGGLRAGDVILGVNGEAVTALNASEEIMDSRPGSRLRLDVLRDTRKRVVKVQRPREGFLGIHPTPLSATERQAQRLSGFEGAYLFAVREGGPADEAGLEAGDILVSIDGQPLSYDTLDDWFEHYGEGARVELGLLRGGQPMALEVTLGRRPRR